MLYDGYFLMSFCLSSPGALKDEFCVSVELKVLYPSFVVVIWFPFLRVLFNIFLSAINLVKKQIYLI